MRDRRPATSRSPRSKACVTKRRRLQWRARGSRSVLPTRGSLFPHSSPSVLRNGVDAIPDCPVGYSQGFPCISGGTFVSVPSPAAQPVVPNEFYVLRYDQAARALFGSLLNEASNAAWVVETQSEAEEPNGLRYRARCCESRSSGLDFGRASKPRVHTFWSSPSRCRPTASGVARCSLSSRR